MKEKSMVVERQGEIGQAEEERALKKKKKNTKDNLWKGRRAPRTSS